MRQAAAVLLKIAILAPSALVAQDSLEGKYSGTFAQKSFSHIGAGVGISITILSVRDGVIEGKGAIYNRIPCKGTYDLTGIIKGNSIVLRSTAGGPTPDCFFRFSGVVENGDLVGKYNGGQAQRFPEDELRLRK